MSDYIDTYLVSADADKLSSFCAQFRNVLGPAAADPALTYACVRSTFALTLPEGISPVDEAVGAAVCGIWS